MDDRVKKNIFLVITYSALLILLIINFTPIAQSFGKVLLFFKSFFIGIAIAFILNKPCMYIEKMLNRFLLIKRERFLSRGLAIAATFLLFFLIVIILISFVIPQLINSMQVLIGNIGVYTENLQGLLNRGTNFLRIEKIDLSNISVLILGYVNKLGSGLSGMMSQVISITAGILSFIANFLISIIFSIYLLAGKEKLLYQFKRVLYTYLPKKVYDKGAYVYYVVIDTFNRYVLGQLTEALILGVLCTLGMLLFQFDYPLLIGVIIGVSGLVPVIGSYIGGFIAFILLLMVNPTKALWFILFLVILQQFEGNVIYPRVVGNSLGLPGIWILLSVTIGGGLAGPLGILLGIPIATVLYILLKNDVNSRKV